MLNNEQTNNEHYIKATPKVLIVEDDPEFSYYLKIILEDYGCTTMIAQDGVMAYRALRTYLPDLITLDLLLPNKTGIQLFIQLRKSKKFSNIPIIVITNYSLTNFPMLNIKKRLYSNKIAPPEAFFEKPIESRKLILAIQHVFDNKKNSNSELSRSIL